MYIERKNSDGAASFSAMLFKAATWRHKLENQYNDPRIAKAEALLVKLAHDAPTLSDSCWESLKTHFETRPVQWRQALSQVFRMVGFKNRITDIESFAEALLEVLNEPVAL